jgi:hypothetical protein
MALVEAKVRARLAVLCPPDAEPTLTADDLDAMVAAARLADLDGNPPDSYQPWPGAGVSLPVGALAVPTTRNGIVYRVTVAAGQGRTGATEPIWPVGTGTVIDNELTWAPYGSAPWTPTWSINAGAAEGWRIKAAKAAENYSFSAGVDRFGVNELLDNCLRMARMYEGSGVAVLSSATKRNVGRWRDLVP